MSHSTLYFIWQQTKTVWLIWAIKKTIDTHIKIQPLKGKEKLNESPISAIPVIHTAGVYEGAEKPMALLLQPLAGKKINTIQDAKYSNTPNKYTYSPTLCFIVRKLRGIKNAITKSRILEIFSMQVKKLGIPLENSIG